MRLREITPNELQQMLADTVAAPLLLDVREPHEFAFCHIAGSLHIPMNQIPQRLAELDADRETVVICHHGIRSRMVADYLLSRGYPHIINLSGGLEAWARTVDPDMPRY
ncbi:sulfurtransferase [Candidatus Woesearchaeota archaeon]|nr:sulfurtransferase [Candidatus Woesearchaeota archaeon]